MLLISRRVFVHGGNVFYSENLTLYLKPSSKRVVSGNSTLGFASWHFNALFFKNLLVISKAPTVLESPHAGSALIKCFISTGVAPASSAACTCAAGCSKSGWRKCGDRQQFTLFVGQLTTGINVAVNEIVHGLSKIRVGGGKFVLWRRRKDAPVFAVLFQSCFLKRHTRSFCQL